MYEHELFVRDRMAELRATASEVKAIRRVPPCAETAGLFTRARWSIGRTITTIGHTVAGERT